MAGRTNTDKIDELARTVAALISTIDAMKTQTAEIPSLSARVAVLEHQVADLRKSLDTLNTRLWQIGIPLILAVLGALLTALLRK